MLNSMLHYIEKSPTCFHAVAMLEEILVRQGYEPLEEGGWKLVPGGKYLTTRNGSSLIAFRVPEAAPTGFMMAASHTDSPCFRVRDHADMPGTYARLSVERYGGMLNAPWVDRPLSIAGRVLVRNGNRVETKLVDFDKPMVLIPNLAIHQNREANNSLKYDAARELFPLYGGKGASFRRDLAQMDSLEGGLAVSAPPLGFSGPLEAGLPPRKRPVNR